MYNKYTLEEWIKGIAIGVAGVAGIGLMMWLFGVWPGIILMGLLFILNT